MVVVVALRAAVGTVGMVVAVVGTVGMVVAVVVAPALAVVGREQMQDIAAAFRGTARASNGASHLAVDCQLCIFALDPSVPNLYMTA